MSWWKSSKSDKSKTENIIEDDIIHIDRKTKLKMKKEEKRRRKEEKKLEKEIRKMKETNGNYGIGDGRFNSLRLKSIRRSLKQSIRLGVSFQFQKQFPKIHHLVITKPPCKEESPANIVYPEVSPTNKYRYNNHRDLFNDDSGEENSEEENEYDEAAFNRYFKKIYVVDESGDLRESESKELTVIKDENTDCSVKSDEQSVNSYIRRFPVENQKELTCSESFGINPYFITDAKMDRKVQRCVIL